MQQNRHEGILLITTSTKLQSKRKFIAVQYVFLILRSLNEIATRK